MDLSSNDQYTSVLPLEPPLTAALVQPQFLIVQHILTPAILLAEFGGKKLVLCLPLKYLHPHPVDSQQ
jgi:hypothetical protein